jgi:hypothetical protein
MEAIRITQKPKRGSITIKLPAELRKQELLEVIILPVEKIPVKKEVIDIKRLKGSVKLNMTVDEIERECEKMRDEWNKGF